MSNVVQLQAESRSKVSELSIVLSKMSEALVQVLYFLENVSVYIFRVQAIGLVSNSVLGFIVFVYLSRIKIVNQKSFSEEIFKICFPLI